MRNKEEERLQINCVNWFTYQYSQYRALFFAIPNGGSRNIIEAANLKKQGVTAGISDVILLYPNKQYHFLCIEFKTTKGKQSESQKEFEIAVNNVGGLYIIIRTFDEFKNFIDKYMTN